MRTFNPLTRQELLDSPRSKSEHFAGMGDTFDYAMPQKWLDTFAAWCDEEGLDVDYDLIRSTTVWAYVDHIGRPVTCCLEVALAYSEWESRVLAL